MLSVGATCSSTYNPASGRYVNNLDFPADFIPYVSFKMPENLLLHYTNLTLSCQDSFLAMVNSFYIFT